MDRADEILREARADAKAGRFAAAIASLRRLIARDPRSSPAHETLAHCLQQTGAFDQAEYFAARATELAPASADARNSLGYIRLTGGKRDAAVADFEAALRLDPRHMGALSNLGAAFRALGRLDDAAAAFERMLATHPESEFAYADANVLLQMGMPNQAAAVLRSAVGRFPGSVWLRRDLCLALNYADDATESEVFKAHGLLGAAILRPGTVAPADPDPGRPLRVAYLSPDFREHSVAYFIRPLLDCAGSGLLPWCYHASRKSDATTARLRAWAEASGGRWCDAAGLSHEALADRLRSDRIDVAVDLAGWTAGSRIWSLSPPAAPLQMTYLGYPNTTGLGTIDCRIVDTRTDPPEASAYSTERLIRLDPCFACYDPPREAPEPDPEPPSAKHGYVTFGSFNSIRKLTPRTVRLWSALMSQVPESRLILKSAGLDSSRAKAWFAGLFRESGIEAHRLEFLARVEPRAAHLALYSRVDVALDSFPYHGTTTTCEALWMGVPVVSLTGVAHRSRVGLSLLSAAGLPELAAPTPEDFVLLAKSVASDTMRLRQLRGTLRAGMAGSPLCDAAAFRDRFSSALRREWRRGCGAPA